MGNSQPCLGGVAKFVQKPNGVFTDLTMAPPDPILNTTTMFKKDTAPDKINLGVGAYRNEHGKPYILPVVKAAEKQLYDAISYDQIDKEYSPIDGEAKLKPLTQKLVFGPDAKAVAEERICSVQALSGTGSLRVCGEFVKKHLQPASHTIWMSDPTWGNHTAIFQNCGLTVKTYGYYDPKTRGLNFEKMMEDLRMAEPGNMVLLHACAHNPTGVDPSQEQWQKILDLCKSKPLIPIMDSAYQGYASGSLDTDAYSIRLFEKAGLEFFMCQSFAKNLGMYGERIGMLHIVCSNKERADVVLSQVKLVIRPMYSSPPIHGAQLLVKILGEPTMFAQWKTELKEMADRIYQVRTDLENGLKAKGTPGTWNHITAQIGMFSFTGLTGTQCERLIEKHHIYLLKSGRISLAGLNQRNIRKMIDAVDEAVRACPEK